MFNFNSAPTKVTKFEPRLEDHDKQRVKTVRVWLELNRASSFQTTLWPNTVLEEIENAFWDSDENKRPGIRELKYDSVFTNVNLDFVENGSPRVSFKDATIEKITAKPIAGKVLQIKCQALAIVTDGDLDGLHDILKSNGVNMSAVQHLIPRDEAPENEEEAA